MPDSDLDYCKIVGRIGLTVGDGPDAGDNPDILRPDPGATVVFEPLQKYTKVDGATPPVTLGQANIVCWVDPEGYLTYPEPVLNESDGTYTYGNRWVWLVDLGSDKVNPVIARDRAAYRVTYKNVTFGGTKVDFPTFTFHPLPEVENDLTLLAPVPVGGGQAIVVGPQGRSVNAFQLTAVDKGRFVLDDGTLLNEITLPAGAPGGSDTSFAQFVGTAGTATRVATEKVVAPALRPAPVAPKTRPRYATTAQAGHGFTTPDAGVTLTDDTTMWRLGSQSIRMNINAGVTGKLQRFGGPALDATDSHFVVDIWIEDITQIDTIALYAGANNLGNYFRLNGWTGSAATERGTLSQRWTPLTFSWSGKLTDVGTPNRVAITDLQLRVAAKSGGTGAVVRVGSIGVVKNSPKFPNGVATFRWDDGFSSVYTDGRRIMDKYGFPGIVYLLAENIGLPGKLTLEQCRILQDRHGWEMGGHAFLNSSEVNRMTSLNATQLEDEFRNLKRWLLDNGFRSDSYCYPGGEQNQLVIDICSRYFNNACDTSGQPRYNPPATLDAMMLTNVGAGAGALTAIANAAQNKDWVMLYGHKVGTGGISFADLEAQVDAVFKAGLEVLTPGQVMARLRAA